MSAVRRPQLFLVGAPKAGTSALANLLARHPQIGMCKVKEPNYFNRDLDLPRPVSESEYLSLFPQTPETELLADASILYLYSRTAAEAIAAYAPDARILVMLRDPVDAMHAWHSQMVFTANEPIRDFREALDAEALRVQGRSLPGAGVSQRCPELLFYRDVMRYAEQLERYLGVFDAGQIHVVAYDDFAASPRSVFAGVVDFLGLDRGFEPEWRVVNPNKVRRSWALHYGLKKVFARPVRALLPLRARLALIKLLDRVNSRQEARAGLDPALRAALREECRPDVERLGELLGRDYAALWSG